MTVCIFLLQYCIFWTTKTMKTTFFRFMVLIWTMNHIFFILWSKTWSDHEKTWFWSDHAHHLVPILWVLTISLHIRYYFVWFNMGSLLRPFWIFEVLKIWGFKICLKVTSYQLIQNNIGYVRVLSEFIELVRIGQNGYI